MGLRNIYERFIWFDHQARAKKYPNATSLAEKFEISTKTAQRDIDHPMICSTTGHWRLFLRF